MSTTQPLRRRDQQVVAKLVEVLPPKGSEDLTKARARARSLPTMLRRHGPIPVLLFLESKKNEKETAIEPRLGHWLLAGMAAVLPEVGEKPAEVAKTLAEMPLERYLMHWQTSVETAAWLKRLIEARTEAPGSSGGGGG